jgi:hypothetical protein
VRHLSPGSVSGCGCASVPAGAVLGALAAGLPGSTGTLPPVLASAKSSSSSRLGSDTCRASWKGTAVRLVSACSSPPAYPPICPGWLCQRREKLHRQGTPLQQLLRRKRHFGTECHKPAFPPRKEGKLVYEGQGNAGLA